jgi:hypothetical protein
VTDILLVPTGGVAVCCSLAEAVMGVGGSVLVLLREASLDGAFEGDFSLSTAVGVVREAEDALRSLAGGTGVPDTTAEPRRSLEVVEMAEPRLKIIVFNQFIHKQR